MSIRFRVRTCSLILLVACAGAGVALAASVPPGVIDRADPDWTLGFDSPIEWQRVTPLGQLIVSTASGLHGVDPESGQIAWSRTDLGPLSEERFELIPETPFVVISRTTAPRRVVVLDASDGRSVFDSKQAGIRELLGKNVLVGSGGLLVVGLPTQGDDPVLALYEIDGGERRWVNTTIFARPEKVVTQQRKPRGKFFRMMEKVAERSAPPPEPSTRVAAASGRIETDPIELGPEAFLLSSDKGLFRIDARTGEVDWKIGMFLRRTCQVYVSAARPELVLVGNRSTHTVNDTVQRVESVYRAYRATDGTAIWKAPVRLDGELNPPIFHERGLVLSPRTDGRSLIKFVDYASGASLWSKKGKGIKIAGGIIDHMVIGDEIVLTTGRDNAWSNKGTEYLLNVLDVAEAALRFKKSHKVKGRMLGTEVLPHGILYVTTSELNVLDLETGQPMHRPVVSEGSLIAATAGELVYAFSSKDRSLYVLDRSDASLRKISEAPVKLAEGEVPFSLEVGAEQITLVSSQNIAGFAPDGSLRFHAHHPAPRRSGLMRALLMANAVRAGIASAASGIYAGGFAAAASRHEPGTVGKTITAGLAEGYGELAVGHGSLSREYAQAAKQRYKASAISADFVFMMVRVDGTRFGLAQVSKRDGAIVTLIDLYDDKTPSYEVDSIANRIYYRARPDELVGFRFGEADAAKIAERR